MHPDRTPSSGVRTPATAHERNPVNKSDLVSAIAKRADVPASTVDSVLAGLQEELVEAITRGEKVAVSGLLTVERTQRSRVPAATRRRVSRSTSPRPTPSR